MTTPNARQRWYRPTPDALVFGLLGGESMLWLSQRFHWFPFNDHKGWTVLIAVAAVTLATLILTAWFALAVVVRCRFQFNLGSLLLFMAVVAVPCGWLATEYDAARRQNEAAMALDRGISYNSDEARWLIGRPSVVYDFQIDEDDRPTFRSRPGPAILRRILGDDFFASVKEVTADGHCPSDAQMARLEAFPTLESLSVAHSFGGSDRLLTDRCPTRQEMGNDLGSLLRSLNTGPLACLGTHVIQGRWSCTWGRASVSDAGLKHIGRLRRLQVLDIRDTQATDVGLSYLVDLTRLRVLDLGLTGVTDAGLRRLEPLTRLEFLWVDGTRVTGVGLRFLKPMTGLRHLGLANTYIGDDALEYLRPLTNLESLDLSYTRVDDRGLRRLLALPSLRLVWLEGAPVTQAALDDVQKALPACTFRAGITISGLPW